jgi:transposase
MPRPGPPYSPEFRAEAVRLLRSGGKTVAELSRELGVSQQTLRKWRLQAGDDRGEAAGVTSDERSRLQELERENRLLREERESRRFNLNYQGKDRFVRRLARLSAEVIEAGVAVVTLPAKWAANGLRWYAAQKDEPPGKASEEQDGEGPVAAE